jgi:hypothetical protein
MHASHLCEWQLNCRSVYSNTFYTLPLPTLSSLSLSLPPLSFLSLPFPSLLSSLFPLPPLSSLSLSPLLSLSLTLCRDTCPRVYTRAAAARARRRRRARAIEVEEGRERERGTYLRRGDDGVDDGSARRRRSPGQNFGSLTAGSVKDWAPKT